LSLCRKGFVITWQLEFYVGNVNAAPVTIYVLMFNLISHVRANNLWGALPFIFDHESIALSPHAVGAYPCQCLYYYLPAVITADVTCRLRITKSNCCSNRLNDSCFRLLLVLLTTREASWYIISVVSLCLSVCQTITFESLDVGSSSLHIRYILFQGTRVCEDHRVKVKVTRAKKV